MVTGSAIHWLMLTPPRGWRPAGQGHEARGWGALPGRRGIATQSCAMISIKERREDGQVQRWTVEGPILPRLDRMSNEYRTGLSESRRCHRGLRLRHERRIFDSGPSPDTDGLSPQFVHGHVLVMPKSRPTRAER